MKPLSIYIHIPFCISKCFYCDFPSYAGKEDIYEDYIKSLICEIENSSQFYKEYKIKTVFIGGGTPTVLPCDYIIKILESLNKNYNICGNSEITIEANPGTINYTKLIKLRKSGINRLSLGLQAWQSRLLNELGRIYNQEKFIEEFYLAREANFNNINLDLMFAIPNQTLVDWIETLEKVIYLKPEHISTYSLIVEEGTPFGDLYAQNKLKLPDEDIDRQMYYKAKEILKQNGYIHYEISNFAQSEFKCNHNLVYWKQNEYIGFGLGAHSFIDSLRFHNTYNMDKYINNAKNKKFITENIEKNDILDSYAEFMFLGLRLLKGISKNEFKFKFGIDIYDIYGNQLNECKKFGLIKEMGDFISLTPRGIDISNLVFEKFLIK